MAEEFVGAGLAFPMRTDPTGAIALVTHEQELRESIRLILGTARGERPMRPEFGCGIHDLLFHPANEETAGRAAYEVQVALERWEPRIDIEDITVTYEASNQAVMYIHIDYKVSGSNDPRNLVFPFYVIPEE